MRPSSGAGNTEFGNALTKLVEAAFDVGVLLLHGAAQVREAVLELVLQRGAALGDHVLGFVQHALEIDRINLRDGFQRGDLSFDPAEYALESLLLAMLGFVKRF